MSKKKKTAVKVAAVRELAPESAYPHRHPICQDQQQYDQIMEYISKQDPKLGQFIKTSAVKCRLLIPKPLDGPPNSTFPYAFGHCVNEL